GIEASRRKNRRVGKCRGGACAGEASAREERQEGRLTFRLAIMEPDSTPAPFLFVVAWRVVRRSRTAGVVVPNIITIAWAAVCRAPGRLHIKPGSTARRRGLCISQKFHRSIDPDFMRSYVVQMVCAKRES